MNKDKRTRPWSVAYHTVAFIILLAIILLIVTTPLDVESQALFGLAGVVLMLLVSRFKSRWARLVLVLMSIVISTRYLYWRATDTLVFNTPIETILGIGLLLAEVYTWLILVLGFVQTVWPIERKIVPMPKDSSTWPTVDVYVPTYNESLEIVQDTVLAALNLDYPKDKLKVYLLDDGKRPEFGAFAAAAGVGYITRNDNAHAKAGNLNNAMKQTQGELICIFDCDHVATRIFLQATVGSFIADDNLALLQTPHYFYSPDPFDRNLRTSLDLPEEGEMFYGPVQKGNDYWNASFFCGSCAVIRRKALEQTNGFAVETVTEDAHTALRLQRMGWDSAFIGIPMAAGLATERLALHIGQRARWARGMCQILRVDNPLLGKGLKWHQRLCYLNAALHFQFPLPRVIFLTAPLAYLLFGLNIIASSPQLILAYALPHLIHSLHTNSLLHGRHRYTFWGEIYETVLAFALVRPVLTTLWNPKKGKFNVTEKGGLLRDGYFDYDAVRPQVFTLALLFAGVTWGLVRLFWSDLFNIQPSVLLLNLFWASFSALILLASIAVARETRQVRNTVRVDIKLPAILHLSDGHTLSTETCNFSMGGMMLDNPLDDPLADVMVEDVEIRFDNQTLLFPVTTVALDNDYFRFKFNKLPIRQRRQLVNVVMGRADAWVRSEPHPQDNPLRSFWAVLKAVMGLFSSNSTNRGLTRWRKGLMGSWKFRIALVVLIAFGISIVANRAWAADASYQRDISFKEAGQFGPMAVSGNGNSSGIHFSLRQDEMASTADLDLSLSYPDAKFADKTHLEVLLNGQLLKKIPLDPFSADGMENHIPIDAALVLSHNDLNFRVVGQAGPQCVDEDSPQQNEVLISNQSKLHFKLVRLPRPRDLSIFPAPFFDEGIMGQVTVPLVLPQHPSKTVLESGAILASYFGEKAQFRTASFPVTLNGLPDNNAIALVVGDNLAGANLPPPTGPELRIIDNPLDPLYKVLVVMGRTDSEVKTAVEYLLSGADLSGQDVAAKTVTLPKRQPYDAPNWVSTQGNTPLGQLTGPEGLVARGLHHGANEVNFRAPPDLFRWRDRPMSMQVQYLFPEGSWMDERRSKLIVSLNGQFLESLPVNNTGIWASFWHLLGNDVRQQKAKVEIPPYLLYGENKLSFYFDLRLHPGSDCKQVLGTKIISRVLPGSSLDLSGSKHFTKLPNLSYFVGAGFPFTRMADLSQTLALLPSKPTILELQTFFDLIGHMGQDTGYPAYGIEVSKGVKDLDQTAGKDLLVVGSIADIDSGNLLQSSPFQFRQNKLALKPITMADTWKRLISGDWGRQDKAASRQLEAEDNFFGLASFISPADQHRVVVVATASQEQQLPNLVERLQEPQVSSQVHGDLVLFQNQQIRSYRVGPRVGTGKMSWEMNLGWYFGNHVLQLLIMMLLCILLGATLIYPYLKHRAKTRQAQDEDNRHE